MWKVTLLNVFLPFYHASISNISNELVRHYSNQVCLDLMYLVGRPEKLPDVCYSWWVLASLKIIGKIHWIDKEKLSLYILACQDEETGGFADRPGDMVDYKYFLFIIMCFV